MVELDFAATQAVNHDVDEYEVDPDDFYETGARGELEGSQEESEEEEGEKQPTRKCREGFRTAAVERDRAQDQLSRISEGTGSYSSSPDAQVEYAVPLTGGEDDDDEQPQPEVGMSPPRSLLELSDDDPQASPSPEMDFPSPAQPSRAESDRRKSPPPPPPVFEEVSLPSDEEDEETLPHWRDLGKKGPATSAPKENRPPSAAPKGPAKIVPVVQVAQKRKFDPRYRLFILFNAHHRPQSPFSAPSVKVSSAPSLLPSPTLLATPSTRPTSVSRTLEKQPVRLRVSSVTVVSLTSLPLSLGRRRASRQV